MSLTTSIWLFHNFNNQRIIEFSVKSGKHSTRTLSLVQNRVRLKKKLQKKYPKKPKTINPLSIKGGWNLEMHQFHLVFTLSFLFPERLHCYYRYLHCSYLYNYYNYLESCALLNAKFQHFIPRFNTISLPRGPDSKKRG